MIKDFQEIFYKYQERPVRFLSCAGSKQIGLFLFYFLKLLLLFRQMHSYNYYYPSTFNSFDLYDECGFIEQDSPFDVSSLINSPLSLDSESGNMTSSSVETSP